MEGITAMTPYEWAKNEAGVAEVPGPGNNPRIIFYDQYTTLKATADEVAWCSSFVCAAHEAVHWISTKSAAARSWLNWGVSSLGNPQVGDVVILKRGKNPRSGHVAFLDAPFKKGDKSISLFGGNQQNKVCSAKYKGSDVLDIRRWPT
jgi:uncharacterized protein (TIGR02594 family)